MYRRGQSSLEQLIITALGIAFIAIIFYFSLNFASDSIRVSQAQDLVDKLANTVDYLDSLGPGSKDTVVVTIPDGTKFIEISGNRIWIRVSISSGYSDIFAYTDADLVGSIDLITGPQEIILQTTEDGKVQFGDSLLICTPTQITQTLYQSNSSSTSITITNMGSEQLTLISANQTGNLNSLLTIIQPSSTLNSGSSDSVDLNFNIPVDYQTGTYSGTVSISSDEGSSCSTYITLNILRAGGPDTQGPAITYLNYSPLTPTTSTSITITATGDDSSTGSSTISSCEIELDYSGIWNNMNAVDGSFDETIEQVTYSLGTLAQGMHTIRVRCTDSESNIGTPASISFNVTTGGGDTQGPIVTSIINDPLFPTTFNSIAINATADDSTTGGSTISSCEIELDNSGTWNSMNAVDGSFDSVLEDVTYSLGILNAGNHSVAIRCTDSSANTGLEYTHNFTVISSGYLKDILIITLDSIPSSNEQLWISWISTHSSNESYDWDYDTASVGEVNAGTTNASNYQIVVMADFPNNDVTLNSILLSYTSSNYIVLLGGAVKFGVLNLNLGSGNAVTQNKDELKVQSFHYITTDYTLNSLYTIYSTNSEIYYHSGFTGTNILSMENNNGRVVSGQGSNILIYGPARPDLFTSDGDTFAIRTLDYALLNSG